MKKLLVFLIILIVTPLIGGIYGVLHDQLTYTISPEYFTKFKFYQFGMMDDFGNAIWSSERVGVGAVGFLATWWMGIPIGLVICLLGIRHRNTRFFLKRSFQTIGIIIGITFLTGIVGLLIGVFFLTDAPPNWWYPHNLVDQSSFIMVGSMHNFSYLGGLLGLVVGSSYFLFSNISRKAHLSQFGIQTTE